MSYVRIRKVKCGTNCTGCPHGPFAYLCWRDKGQLREKYLGPVRNLIEIQNLRSLHGYEIAHKVANKLIALEHTGNKVEKHEISA